MAQNPNDSGKVPAPAPVLNFNKEVTMKACSLAMTGDIKGNMNGIDVDEAMQLTNYLKSSDYKASIMASVAAQEKNLKEKQRKSESYKKSLKYEEHMPKDNNKGGLLVDIEQDMLNAYIMDSSNPIGAESIRQKRLLKNHAEEKQRADETNEEFEERQAIKAYGNDKGKQYKKDINSDDILSAPLFNAPGSVSPFYVRLDDDNNGDTDIDMMSGSGNSNVNKEKNKEKENEKSKEKEKAKEKEKESIQFGNLSESEIKNIVDSSIVFDSKGNAIPRSYTRHSGTQGYTVVSSTRVRDDAITFDNDSKEKLTAPFPYRDARAFGKSTNNDELNNNRLENGFRLQLQTLSKKACNIDPRLQRMNMMIPPPSTTTSARGDIDSAPNNDEQRDSIPIFNQN